VAQKTTLIPSGIPGQVYGSFAGKVPFVPTAIIMPDNAAYIFFRDKRAIVDGRDKRAVNKFRDKRVISD
jgi:hypothetical protein